MLAKALQGATAAADKLYIESVFQTWLYTGNSSTQTISNGIDLAGKGGLVWIKSRSLAQSHYLFDTERGADKGLTSDDTAGQSAGWTPNWFTSFNSSGFTLGPNGLQLNSSTGTYASWTFRKAAKFFDVVSYVGDGSASRYVSHNLGSKPGCVFIKATSATSDWGVWHRYTGTQGITNFSLNKTNAGTASSGRANYTDALYIRIGTGEITPATGTCNDSGVTYVAYLFAHDAGGFGDSGNDSVVKCGSFTESGSGTTVALGWEPQWLLFKRIDSTGSDWFLLDTMRLMTSTGAYGLYPNLSSAESATAAIGPTATGFSFGAGQLGTGTWIYIAIRRGPMKTPTDATEVFKGVARTGTGASATVNGFGFSLDAVLTQTRNSATSNAFIDRLRGDAALSTQGTASEATGNGVKLDVMDGYTVSTAYNPWNNNTTTTINWGFRRAPGFFDVVAYTGTNTSGQNAVSHNLGVTPELIIYKLRTGPTTAGWYVYAQPLGVANHLVLNTPAASASYSLSNGVSPTATAFYTTPGDSATSASGYTYIAYLFASCPGVSKCFNYTGTGTTLQIDCGFTNGARLVLIKRTDSTGDWYIWDSARGIISGNDSYLLLNSTAAEVTNTDYIDPYSAGFEISSTAPAAINASGGSYIGLAIA